MKLHYHIVQVQYGILHTDRPYFYARQEVTLIESKTAAPTWRTLHIQPATCKTEFVANVYDSLAQCGIKFDEVELKLIGTTSAENFLSMLEQVDFASAVYAHEAAGCIGDDHEDGIDVGADT
tara:strand:+ start:273 stop:638 length:366 start_codon:yes stop_codon:yes gene_type:complete